LQRDSAARAELAAQDVEQPGVLDGRRGRDNEGTLASVRRDAAGQKQTSREQRSEHRHLTRGSLPRIARTILHERRSKTVNSFDPHWGGSAVGRDRATQTGPGCLNK